MNLKETTFIIAFSLNTFTPALNSVDDGRLILLMGFPAACTLDIPQNLSKSKVELTSINFMTLDEPSRIT